MMPMGVLKACHELAAPCDAIYRMANASASILFSDFIYLFISSMERRERIYSVPRAQLHDFEPTDQPISIYWRHIKCAHAFTSGLVVKYTISARWLTDVTVLLCKFDAICSMVFNCVMCIQFLDEWNVRFLLLLLLHRANERALLFKWFFTQSDIWHFSFLDYHALEPFYFPFYVMELVCAFGLFETSRKIVDKLLIHKWSKNMEQMCATQRWQEHGAHTPQR